MRYKNGVKRRFFVLYKLARGKLRHMHGGAEFFCYNLKPAHVVAVLVRYENRGNIAKACADFLKRIFDGTGGNARIYKYFRGFGANVVAVAR
jgi:hypothetical protein